MHPTLDKITKLLRKLNSTIEAQIQTGETLSTRQGWQSPALNSQEITKISADIIEDIEARGTEYLGGNEKLIDDYPIRIQHLIDNVAPYFANGNAHSAYVAYISTIKGLESALSTAFRTDAEVSTSIRRSATRLRSIKSRLDVLEPESGEIEEKLRYIRAAHDAAEQLPTDLESLHEAQKRISKLEEISRTDQLKSKMALDEVTRISNHLKTQRAEAASIVAELDKAYASATSQGLAQAFSERSRKLGYSATAWGIGLVVALAAGALFGGHRVQQLISALSDTHASSAAVFANLVLSAVSIGGPVWFAWLATKQVGQRFRLSEDYAFKASVSRAYEGYRKEAARMSSDMETQLLASALTRLDEQPLRLIEPQSYGSPIHEIASSEALKSALKSIPGFAKELNEFVSRRLAVASGSEKAESLPQSVQHAAQKSSKDSES
jgi:hypothetical protein